MRAGSARERTGRCLYSVGKVQDPHYWLRRVAVPRPPIWTFERQSRASRVRPRANGANRGTRGRAGELWRTHTPRL